MSVSVLTVTDRQYYCLAVANACPKPVATPETSCCMGSTPTTVRLLGCASFFDGRCLKQAIECSVGLFLVINPARSFEHAVH